MKKRFKLALFIPFLFSCSLMNTKKDVKEEIKDGDVSVGSILDLTRSSYLKGCIDGIKHLTQKKSKGVYFEFCKVKAKSHEEEVLSIIK